MWMLLPLWLVVAHNLLEYRYKDDVTGNLFSLSCSTWRVIWKCWWDYFGLSQWKPCKKFSRRYLQTRNYGETETKRVLDNLRMSELQEIFTTVAIVCHRHERLAVCKMFSPLLCFEHEKTSKRWMQVRCK